MSEFEGKVVLITGATGNVGTAVARRFARTGARLALVARVAADLDALADELQTETLALEADLTDADDVERVINDIETIWGQIDVLVHAVGGYAGGQAVYEPGTDLLEKMWRLNVLPVQLVAGRVARHMLDHDVRGHIIIFGARAGLRGGARSAAYSAAKAAAMRIAESLAAEVRDRGIHVNLVLPSTIDTPDNREAMPKADADKWATPEQFADVVAFLASAASAGMYGASVEVYGRV